MRTPGNCGLYDWARDTQQTVFHDQCCRSRDIIVIIFVKTDPDDAHSTLMIDGKARSASLMYGLIKPEISRTFGILRSDDDFQ